MFHDIERENQKTPDIATDSSDSEDGSNITYVGPRFKVGCALFDKHVLSQHRDMEEERTKYKTEDAVAMNSSASLILQHVICKGIDIIKHQGCSRFDLINEAFTSQVGEPPKSTMTTEAENKTGTTAKPTSSKTTSATSSDKLVRRRHRTMTNHYEPEVKKTKPQKRLPSKKRRYTEDEVKLEKARKTYEDVEFQLKMKYIEYVDHTKGQKTNHYRRMIYNTFHILKRTKSSG